MKAKVLSSEVAANGYKNGRPWTKYKASVEFEGGKVETIYIFDILKPGEEYELEKVTSADGKYTNWRVFKENRGMNNGAGQQILTALGVINEKLDELMKRTDHMRSNTTSVKVDPNLPF